MARNLNAPPEPEKIAFARGPRRLLLSDAAAAALSKLTGIGRSGVREARPRVTGNGMARYLRAVLEHQAKFLTRERSRSYTKAGPGRMPHAKSPDPIAARRFRREAW